MNCTQIRPNAKSILFSAYTDRIDLNQSADWLLAIFMVPPRLVMAGARESGNDGHGDRREAHELLRHAAKQQAGNAPATAPWSASPPTATKAPHATRRFRRA